MHWYTVTILLLGIVIAGSVCFNSPRYGKLCFISAPDAESAFIIICWATINKKRGRQKVGSKCVHYSFYCKCAIKTFMMILACIDNCHQKQRLVIAVDVSLYI